MKTFVGNALTGSSLHWRDRGTESIAENNRSRENLSLCSYVQFTYNYTAQKALVMIMEMLCRDVLLRAMIHMCFCCVNLCHFSKQIANVRSQIWFGVGFIIATLKIAWLSDDIIVI